MQHIQFKLSYTTWADNVFLLIHRLTKNASRTLNYKPPVPEVKNYSCSPLASERLPEQSRCPWLPPGVAIAEDTMNFGLGTQMTWAGTDLKASCLRSSFQRTGECHASFQGREEINNPTKPQKRPTVHDSEKGHTCHCPRPSSLSLQRQLENFNVSNGPAPDGNSWHGVYPFILQRHLGPSICLQAIEKTGASSPTMNLCELFTAPVACLSMLTLPRRRPLSECVHCKFHGGFESNWVE